VLLLADFAHKICECNTTVFFLSAKMSDQYCFNPMAIGYNDALAKSGSSTLQWFFYGLKNEKSPIESRVGMGRVQHND
jgi:hypothetical protein